MKDWEEIWVVICDNQVSTECYKNYQDAVKFIEGRSDNPEKNEVLNCWITEDGTSYKIKGLTLKF